MNWPWIVFIAIVIQPVIWFVVGAFITYFSGSTLDDE